MSDEMLEGVHLPTHNKHDREENGQEDWTRAVSWSAQHNAVLQSYW
jgi:hypothetical protein